MIQANDVSGCYRYVEIDKPIIDLEIQDAGDGYLTTCLYHIHYDEAIGFCYRFDGDLRRSWHYDKDDCIAYRLCKLCDYAMNKRGFTIDDVCKFVDFYLGEWQ